MTSERPRRRLTAPVGTLALVVLLVGAVGWFGQRALVYYPDRSDPGPAAQALPGGQDVTLRTADGLTLEAWYVPAQDGCPTVLVAPGNGGNRAGRVLLAEGLVETGAGVLLVDYRGYGGNPGRPTQEGLALDLRAARAHLTDDAGVDPGRLVYLGESLGTAVATDLAATEPPAGLVLRSPFTSMRAVADALYGVPLGWALRDPYPLLERLAEVDVPVAVVHGDQDTIVPGEQSAEVAEAARDAGTLVDEVVVEGTGHNDLALAAGPRLVGAVEAVAEAAGVPCER